MLEEYLVFYHEGKELLAYTVRGSFAGELEATQELLAYENNIPYEKITANKEMR